MYNRFTARRPSRRQFFKKDSSQAVQAQIVREVKQDIENTNLVAEVVVYQNTNSFENFPIDQQILKNIKAKGYLTPTPIQDQAILPIINGRDLIGIANTGTGKTAAFLIPLINKVYRDKHEKVIIVAPTRELALQIYEEFCELSLGLDMQTVLCIGGSDMRRQKKNLKHTFNFVIGTPGRIKDHIESRSLDLWKFTNVVLDEADRMVDIGFIRDIQYFISLLPQKRQSLFFSATISGKVGEILSQFVKDPVTVSVKEQEIAKNVMQDLVYVKNDTNKIDVLHDLLIRDGFEKVLIFGRTKWGVQKLSDELARRGFKSEAIHGNKRQSQRQRILEQFKTDRINILLATDVASRGLDIPNVSHVINYDIPQSYDDYVHRIGRTGRADKKGTALTFVV